MDIMRVTTVGIGAIASYIKTRDEVTETIPNNPEILVSNQPSQQTTSSSSYMAKNTAYIWKYRE